VAVRESVRLESLLGEEPAMAFDQWKSLGIAHGQRDRLRSVRGTESVNISGLRGGELSKGGVRGKTKDKMERPRSLT